MKTYFIDHCREGSINLGDRVRVPVMGTYQDAVDEAHCIFAGMERKTSVTVHGDSYCLYYYHYIRATGEVTDRNTNSGVVYPPFYEIKFENNAYRSAA